MSWSSDQSHHLGGRTHLLPPRLPQARSPLVITRRWEFVLAPTRNTWCVANARQVSRCRCGATESRPAADFQSHLADLDARGLLIRVDRPIDKDNELHPLVRWQFLGGIAENKRRAFLFTNVTDRTGRRYGMSVAVGALAASPDIYAVGMGQPVANIGQAWMKAIANPIAPVEVQSAPCQDVAVV